MTSLFLNTSPETSIHIRLTRPSTSTKPLLVFLHYWGGSSSTWHKLTSPDSPTSLSKTYPTAAIDLRGWGKSTGPAKETGNTYSISAMASDVASILSHLKESPENKDLLTHGFVIIGHSMGAKVALATLCGLSPDLLQDLRGLVLVAPAPATALVLPAEMKAQQKVAYESEQSVRWTVENVLGNPRNLGEEDVELVVRDSLRGSPLAKAAWPTYGMEEDISQTLRSALASVKGGIGIRILVGELDIVEPVDRVDREVRRFIEESGVQVSLKIVEGARHLLPLESSGSVQEEISSF